MCYHDSKDFYYEDLKQYYNLANLSDAMKEAAQTQIKFYHNNGFDHNLLPVLETADHLALMNWGLIPWYTKSLQEAMRIRTQTLNAISEEMFDKPSFRDSLKDGKRCL